MVDLPNLVAPVQGSTVERLAAAYETIKADLDEIVAELRALDYRFDVDDPVPGPDPDYLTVHRPRYVRIAEEDPPSAWDLFLQIVGPVNLCTNIVRKEREPAGRFLAMLPEPRHSQGPNLGSIYLDPLQVFGTSLPNWQAENGFRVPGAIGYVEVFDETITKAGWSGGGAIDFALPGTEPDPILNSPNGWPNGLRFIELIRISMAWFGLPGLRRVERLPEPLRSLRATYGGRYDR